MAQQQANKTRSLVEDAKQVVERLDHFERDTIWFEAQWYELLEQFPDEWVAVFDERVVAHHSTLDGVIAAIDASGVPRGRSVLRLVERTPRRLIL